MVSSAEGKIKGSPSGRVSPYFAVIFAFALLAADANGQSQFPMTYLDEIGHMDSDLWDDHRKSIDLEVATAYAEGYETLRLEGRDDAGTTWRISLPRVVGVGGTEVWKADFDRNDRWDLLVTQYYFRGGRCTDRFDMYFLLFNKNGRPSIWKIHTSGFSGFEEPPHIVVDINQDGRAELITSNCQYAEAMSEDRSITGIHDARESKLVPLRSASAQPYLDALQAHILSYTDVQWLPTDPAKWAELTELTAIYSD